MPVTYHEIEDRIVQAVEYVADFPDANIAKTARDFDVPPSRLRYRLKTGNSRISVGRQNKKLSPTLFVIAFILDSRRRKRLQGYAGVIASLLWWGDSIFDGKCEAARPDRWAPPLQ